LLSKIHRFTFHGDPYVQNFATKLLGKISAPYYAILQKWIQEGELVDRYREFMIEANPDVSKNELWTGKYKPALEMVPNFFSKELANKVNRVEVQAAGTVDFIVVSFWFALPR